MSLSIALAPRHDSSRWQTTEIEWDDIVAWCDPAHLASSKTAAGCYVLGALNRRRRCATAVTERSGLTLDVDHPSDGFLQRYLDNADWLSLWHTTFSSTPSEPRYRLIIPFSRPVAPDEYVTLARAMMDHFGADEFDPVSARPAQLMFKPAAKRPDWFNSGTTDGAPLDPDEWLRDFVPDLSQLPAPAPGRTKTDPLELGGIVGSFNRAYAEAGWDALIETYQLPYEPDGDRWRLVGAASVSGMGEVAPGLVYSHHSHDPAFGQALSAFDLARVHLFGDLDEAAKPGTPINRLPSSEAMAEKASVDARVVAEMVGADFSAIADDDDPDHWKTKLQAKNRAGTLADSIHNWNLITDNDPIFRALCIDVTTRSIEVLGDSLPWRPVDPYSRGFDSLDRQLLLRYLEDEYKLPVTLTRLEMFVSSAAMSRPVSRIKEYLESLSWDGVPRLEEALPGVRPTPYTRMVARKVLTAAVGRALSPGCKWDHVLVLYGGEGLGKTEWMRRMSKGSTASLGDVKAKDTSMILQRKWIVVADEGYSLRKADADALKEFLTLSEDTYRAPYDTVPRSWPRRCVIWGSTNDEVFLRRQHGNRRFLIVHVADKVDFDALTPDYVDQVWAEAVHLYRNGGADHLYLSPEEEELARAERERYTEEDSMRGVLEAYLEGLYPAAYENWSTEKRSQWLEEERLGIAAENPTVPLSSVSTRQLWHEALGQRALPKPMDLVFITETLARVEGWSRLPGRHANGPYGRQVVYVRTDETSLI